MLENDIKEDREFDIIVWGASGFTGQLVVQYLATKYSTDAMIKWAIGGRNRTKLEKVLIEKQKQEKLPEIIIADSHDRATLDLMTARTKVILSTVGPYAKYGSDLVESCIKNGTDYCDLTGESQWIRRMIDKHEDDAKKSGARIVMSCGFDSIPSDIGVYYLTEHARAQHAQSCASITMLVRAIKGGASGGTVSSILNIIDEVREDRSIAGILANPYTLNPVNMRQGPDSKDQNGAIHNREANVWTAPFLMAAINSRIVRRTNALLNYQYGKEFRYAEATITGSGLKGWLSAITISVGLKLSIIAAAIPAIRRIIIEPKVPKPGEGPTSEEQENGYFNLLMIAKLTDGQILRLRIKGDRDPGYGSTSKMLAESAICLAKDKLATRGGIWTPAAAMGNHLLQRMRNNAGLTFDLE
tara:strand:+ start:131 stop:1372 length:1242 start_codon:yes stop_codon:yes gene_type:complete